MLPARPSRPHPAQAWQVIDEHVGRQRLAAILPLILVVAEAEYYRVCRSQQRTAPLQIGHCDRPMTRSPGEIHRGAFAIRLRLGLEEIRVAVDKQQAVVSAPPKRQHRAEEDRAIAAENDRKLSRVKDGFDGIG